MLRQSPRLGDDARAPLTSKFGNEMARPHKSCLHRPARERLHRVVAASLLVTARRLRALALMLLTGVPRLSPAKGGPRVERRLALLGGSGGRRCARPQSRRGFDPRKRWCHVVDRLASIPAHRLFDGEVWVLDDGGRRDCAQLTSRASRRRSAPSIGSLLPRVSAVRVAAFQCRLRGWTTGMKNSRPITVRA